MANKHDEEEEEETSEEETSEKEGSDNEPPEPKTRSGVLIPLKAPPPTSSSNEDEDDSDTDSDNSSPKPDSNPKPIASKPMVNDPSPKSATAIVSSSKRDRSKPASFGPLSPTSVRVKRLPEKENEAKEAKKSKKKADGPAQVGKNSEKKALQLFQRLWSEEDEMEIQKEMVEYAAKKKADPEADMGAFLEFIKKLLHMDVSKAQLQDKLMRLRKKYENNASKRRIGDRGPSRSDTSKLLMACPKVFWVVAMRMMGALATRKLWRALEQGMVVLLERTGPKPC